MLATFALTPFMGSVFTGQRFFPNEKTFALSFTTSDEVTFLPTSETASTSAPFSGHLLVLPASLLGARSRAATLRAVFWLLSTGALFSLTASRGLMPLFKQRQACRPARTPL